MTAFVLVLAGVAAGDGGQRMGAAGEPVAIRLTGEWSGICRGDGGKTVEVRLEGGVMRYRYRAEAPWADAFTCTDLGGGTFLARWRSVSGTSLGICRLDGERLLLCVAAPGGRPTSFRAGPGTYLYALKLAAPNP